MAVTSVPSSEASATGAALTGIPGQNGVTCTNQFALWYPGTTESASRGRFSLCSINGHWASFQADGNFVVYKANGQPTWASHTDHTGSRFALQGDGNIVVYNSAGRAVWDSMGYRYGRTHAVNFYRLEMQDDGNLVEYAFPRGGGRVAIWASNTAGR